MFYGTYQIFTFYHKLLCLCILYVCMYLLRECIAFFKAVSASDLCKDPSPIHAECKPFSLSCADDNADEGS